MMKFLILFATFVMIFVFCGAASAITDPEPANPYAVETVNSSIDGHNIVYEHKISDDDHDIYIKNLVTGQTKPVTYSGRNDKNPDISGSIVVWQSQENGGKWQIYWKNISTSNPEAQVLQYSSDQINPHISGTFVVWEAYGGPPDADTGNILLADYDIHGYDLTTNTFYNIANSNQYEANPDICGNTVVYQKYEDLITRWQFQVYKTAFNTNNNQGTKIFPTMADQFNPVISGNNVIWVQARYNYGTYYDIYHHNLNTNTGSAVVTDLDETEVALSGNIAVWRRMYSWTDGDIFMKDISSSSNPELSVKWSNSNQFCPAVGVDNYGIFVSYTDTVDGYNRVYWRNMDSVVPTVISPVNNALNIARNKITVTFSEPIKNGSGWIELLNSSGTAIPITKSISGNILTITPKALLATGTKYTIALHTGSITDYAVNSLAGVARTFTTSTDGTQPTVISTDPVNNAVNIARNKKIIITFSEPIKSGNMWIELFNGSTQIPITTSINSNTLTINHATLLATGTKYTIALHTGSITDFAGNSLTGIARYFTTTTDATAPTVTSSDPANNAINVLTNKVIHLTFSEPIKAGNMWIELFNGSTQIPITTSINSNTLTINHATLLATGTKYTIALHTGSITDFAGNSLTGIARFFTTGSI